VLPEVIVSRRGRAQTITSNGAADGTCNENLPNDSIYKRFLYVVSALANNGFYVIVDNHLSYDSTYQNQGQWTALWAQARAAHLPMRPACTRVCRPPRLQRSDRAACDRARRSSICPTALCGAHVAVQAAGLPSAHVAPCSAPRSRGAPARRSCSRT
jgi:hypothetical protein